MISRRFSLVILLLFSLLLPACAEEPATIQQGTVTWIYDGDTLKIDPFGKVRLIGIDTPERKDSKRDQYLTDKGISPARQRQIYLQAKNFNIKQVKGQKVGLTFDATQRDRHDRLLAYLYLPDGRLLNRVLIEEGLAVVYRRFDFSMKKDFLAAEEKARQSERGLWAKGHN